MRWVGALAVGLVAWVNTGCGELSDDEVLSLAFSSTPLSGRSVWVQATRVRASDGVTPAPASGVYDCESAIQPGRCLELDATGRVILPGLCASADAPTGLWNISFILYSAAGCTGAPINSGPDALQQCVPSTDLLTRGSPEQLRGLWLHSTNSSASLVCTPRPYRLVFRDAPGDAVVGTATSPAPRLAVVDAAGVAVRGAGRTITIAATGAAALSGVTLAVTASDGEARFTDVRFSVPGVYTLQAQAPGLLAASSGPVRVAATQDPGLTFVAATAPVQVAVTGTVAVTFPPDTRSGDLLLLVAVNSSLLATTPEAGWTPLVDLAPAKPAEFRLSVWWRSASSATTTAARVETGAGGAALWCVRYRRPSGYPPLPTLAATVIRTGTANPSSSITPAPDLTTSGAEATVLSLVAAREANPLSIAPNNGFSMRLSSASSTAQGLALGLADVRVATSGATPASPTWSRTGSAGQWAWATVAFR